MLNNHARMKIVPTKYRTVQCNACYARNWESAKPEDEIGRYDPDLFELSVGQLTITLCKPCLRDLGVGSISVADGQAESYVTNLEGRMLE